MDIHIPLVLFPMLLGGIGLSFTIIVIWGGLSNYPTLPFPWRALLPGVMLLLIAGLQYLGFGWSF